MADAVLPTAYYLDHEELLIFEPNHFGQYSLLAAQIYVTLRLRNLGRVQSMYSFMYAC